MSNERDRSEFSDIEPAPDPALRAALEDALGRQPATVDWGAMEQRARTAAIFRLRARARATPWWEQVTPWASRLLPVGAVAAAAALALAMATPRPGTEPGLANATSSANVDASDSHDAIADAVAAPNGEPVSGVSGPVDDDWFWDATASAHAAEH